MPDTYSIVITRQVRSDATGKFEEALREWIPQAVTFPGHLGVFMVKPPPGGHEYGALLRFRSIEDWQSFQQWPPYQAFLASIRPLLLSEPKTEAMHGMEAWFQLQSPRHAPRWKMAIITWIGVNIAGTVLAVTVRPFMESWPFVIQFVCANTMMVVALTWGVMPILVKLLRPWLERKKSRT